MTAKEFVILCARKSLFSGQKELIRKSLNQAASWPEILQVARLERVAELVYLNLKPHADDIPAWVMPSLKKQYLFNLKRNLILLHILKPLLISISNKNIRAILIKGVRLAWDVYQDPGLRSFLDVDFFVDRNDRKKLLVEMKELGFLFPDEMAMTSSSVWKMEENLTFRPVFQKDILKIEIHHSLPGLHLPLVQENRVWDECREKKLNGAPARVLSLEYELCALCMHAQQHSYSRLMWIVDIAEISALPQLNWDKVFRICRTEKIEEIVFFTLKLVNNFWEQTVPPKILAGFSVSPMRIKLMQWLWPAEDIRCCYPVMEFPMHAATFFSVLSRGSLLRIFLVIKNFLFPPRRWVAYYYKIPKFSWKMIRHYTWRLTYPVVLLARHFLKLG